jgi:hypothetical protein
VGKSAGKLGRRGRPGEARSLVGGTLAVSTYTGLPPQKHVDVFCKAGDYPRILAHFRRHGFDTEV